MMREFLGGWVSSGVQALKVQRRSGRQSVSLRQLWVTLRDGLMALWLQQLGDSSDLFLLAF